MELVKIIKYLLSLNIKIGKKLTYLLAKYEADEYAENNEKFDLRAIPGRIKNLLIHDKDIIDKRLSICKGCEHFIGVTSQCRECGCFMKVKTRLSVSQCPLNPPKWEKVNVATATS